MPKPYVIVAGDFTPWGGMDRPNYELAWYLAEHHGAEVHLVSHRVASPLSDHFKCYLASSTAAVRPPRDRRAVPGLSGEEDRQGDFESRGDRRRERWQLPLE